MRTSMSFFDGIMSAVAMMSPETASAAMSDLSSEVDGTCEVCM